MLTLAVSARGARGGIKPVSFSAHVRGLDGNYAASRFIANGEKVLDIALDCGFGDVSNFNRHFEPLASAPKTFDKTSLCPFDIAPLVIQLLPLNHA
jgi:methylphosphotriester-DNA--protein-cysteine methyltransferase